jgi:hypothetical protein
MPSPPAKRPSIHADRELDHIEAIIKMALASREAKAVKLDQRYWVDRVNQVGRTHEMLSAQLRRSDELLRLLDLNFNPG